MQNLFLNLWCHDKLFAQRTSTSCCEFIVSLFLFLLLVAEYLLLCLLIFKKNFSWSLGLSSASLKYSIGISFHCSCEIILAWSRNLFIYQSIYFILINIQVICTFEANGLSDFNSSSSLCKICNLKNYCFGLYKIAYGRSLTWVQIIRQLPFQKCARIVQGEPLKTPISWSFSAMPAMYMGTFTAMDTSMF